MSISGNSLESTPQPLLCFCCCWYFVSDTGTVFSVVVAADVDVIATIAAVAVVAVTAANAALFDAAITCASAVGR